MNLYIMPGTLFHNLCILHSKLLKDSGQEASHCGLTTNSPRKKTPFEKLLFNSKDADNEKLPVIVYLKRLHAPWFYVEDRMFVTCIHFITWRVTNYSFDARQRSEYLFRSSLLNSIDEALQCFISCWIACHHALCRDSEKRENEDLRRSAVPVVDSSHKSVSLVDILQMTPTPSTESR